jgi:hypothetical protein
MAALSESCLVAAMSSGACSHGVMTAEMGSSIGIDSSSKAASEIAAGTEIVRGEETEANSEGDWSLKSEFFCGFQRLSLSSNPRIDRQLFCGRLEKVAPDFLLPLDESPPQADMVGALSLLD